MYFLAMHPDVCHRLREEVLETFGPTGAPTYADLKTMGYRACHIHNLTTPFTYADRMPYIVHAVLKETLRIFPSAPLVARTSRDDPLIIPNTNAGNLYLPPKTQIMMSSLLAHKRTDLWGPDAEAFRPDRWLEPALLEKVAKTPFMYSPFYGGPRVVSQLVTPSSFSSSFLSSEISAWDRNSR